MPHCRTSLSLVGARLDKQPTLVEVATTDATRSRGRLADAVGYHVGLVPVDDGSAGGGLGENLDCIIANLDWAQHSTATRRTFRPGRCETSGWCCIDALAVTYQSPQKFEWAIYDLLAVGCRL